MKNFTRILLFVIAAAVAFIVHQVSLFPGPIKNESFGSAFFPLLLAGLMIFLIALIWIENQKAEDQPVDFVWAKLRRPVFFIAFGVFFALTLPSGGFVLCSMAFLLAGMRTCQVKWRTAAISSSLMTAVIYLIFKTLLKVPLPMGTLWENFL